MSVGQARITTTPQDVVAPRRGMFGATKGADTSRYGCPIREVRLPGGSPRQYGDYFDEVVDQLAATLYDGGIAFGEAVEKVEVFRGQLTLHVIRRYIVVVAGVLRDNPRLRFELCLGVSGVHYPADVGRELHAVYPLMSIAHNRRVRLEVAVPEADSHAPSLFSVYPTAEWHERETYDLLGIVFDRHPHRNTRQLAELPAEQRPFNRPDPGGIQRRRDTRARREEGIRLMADRRPPSAGQRGHPGTGLTAGGTDWDQIVAAAVAGDHEHIVVSIAPQHPSTRGVLQLILDIEGQTVTAARCASSNLHTRIEKSMEYRKWLQCGTFMNRMKYLSPFFNEAVYCLGVEKLLDVSEAIPQQVNVIRVLLMELNRISSHLVTLAMGGMELDALTANPFVLRERELTLSVFETITSLRMNHDAYIRPGGLARDLPGEAIRQIRDLLKLLPKRLEDMENRLKEESRRKACTQGIGSLDLSQCIELGVTGPLLRSAGLTHDLRRAQPYCGYETYEFEVITDTAGDAHARYLIRVKEIKESLRIIEQCLDRLTPGPIMADDPKFARLTHLALGPDDFDDSRKHLARIMGTSMAVLIHHSTEGIRVPAGQVYVAVESPCGELGMHIVSDGGTQPYRVHYHDPSFTNLQAFAAMCEGATIADVIAAVQSIDPVMRVHR